MANVDYEKSRAHLLYYKKVLSIIENNRKQYSYNSIIDVGGWKGAFVKSTQIPNKTILDLHKMEKDDNITRITANFLTHNTDIKYDIVTCLQVLEHIDDDNVEAFAKKLFELGGKCVIISVPYKWRKGASKHHLQDPVDEKKLFSWTSIVPDNQYIVTDNNRNRLIAAYKF